MNDTPLTDTEAIRLRTSVASHQAMVAFARSLERLVHQQHEKLKAARLQLAPLPDAMDEDGELEAAALLRTLNGEIDTTLAAYERLKKEIER